MPHHVYFVGPYHPFVGGPPILGLFAVAAVLVPLFLLLMLASWWRSRHPDPEVPPSTALPSPNQAPDMPASPTRASDAEREAAVRRVSHAMVEGRLSLDEGTRRIDHVLGARFRHDLHLALDDLPEPAPTAALPSALRVARPVALGVALALVLAAVLAQAIGGVWELWPASLAALGLHAALRSR